MALNPKRSNLAANTACDAMAALADGGFLDIYDGAQPASADTPVAAQVKLAHLTFGRPAFSASVAGAAPANAIASDFSAAATGRATWFRIWKSDGVTALYDGSVGLADADLIIDGVNIQLGARVNVTGLTLAEGK